METNQIDEINKLENQIRETQLLLESNSNVEKTIKSIKNQRLLLGIVVFLLLLGLIWALLYKNKPLNISDNENITFIDKDSLAIYKTSFYTLKPSNVKGNLNDEKIIYSVQIGAFTDFELTSSNILTLTEFQDNGYNKFSLGNYKTYEEALVLKDSLKRLGFKDSFLTAKSFGNSIGIRDALALSEEPQYLEQ